MLPPSDDHHGAGFDDKIGNLAKQWLFFKYTTLEVEALFPPKISPTFTASLLTHNVDFCAVIATLTGSSPSCTAKPTCSSPRKRTKYFFVVVLDGRNTAVVVAVYGRSSGSKFLRVFMRTAILSSPASIMVVCTATRGPLSA